MSIPSNRSPSPEHFKRLVKAIQGLRVESNHLKDDKGNQVRLLQTMFGLARPYDGPKDVELYHKEDEQAYTVATYWAKKSTSLRHRLLKFMTFYRIRAAHSKLRIPCG
ncbi:hypothetical protein HO173_013004 [Letharia columbiana]|uniref:Uncharacterized protein n=1 Tax=Letharia columbiana TaxID=112416 RepID=A0A8H6CJC0_9LECA|nr:uncharacterized protein HO173_013004 [Letharia columbiana]KAF6224564.1 hypothetical protein HO173_013004 [Letharia columbiana]